MNPDTTPKSQQVVFTNKARCRDCHRCIRVCPVKAIRMRDGQAFVEEDRCIACGTCIRECPQGAKSYRKDLAAAQSLIESGEAVAASVAPSFAALWPAWQRKRLPSALRRLGFTYAGETAIGAYLVAHETARNVEAADGGPHICSACPAVVSYIECYDPAFTENLVPVVSPMIAHAQHIKETRGQSTRIVFIGPCTAKKAEAMRPEYAGLVDCVLTFAELEEWLQSENIDLAQCEESAFDDEPAGEARYFPVPGGLARTASMETDMLDLGTIAVSGVSQLHEVLDAVRGTDRNVLIEPLFCHQGCVSGAGMPGSVNPFGGRDSVLEYAAAAPGAAEKPAIGGACSATRFHTRHIAQEPPSEEAIMAELERTGKGRPEDQLNCGACGYPSCREKAIANLMGMAEPAMCVPYMRRLAEQRSDRIIETSPNGIVIIDEHLNIIGMNPAFKRMFFCTDAVYDKPISYLMDPAPFEKLATGEEELVVQTLRHDNYKLICHERFYALRDEKQYVGIFVNITKSHEDEEQLRTLRSATVMQAQDLLNHQVEMAQRMVQFLGESTAKGESLVRHLMELAEQQNAKR